MKDTGLVRRIDDLGRVVIPKEFRRSLGFDLGDPLEIFVDGGAVIMKKYQPGCKLCGSVDDLLQVSDVLICNDCALKLSKNYAGGNF